MKLLRYLYTPLAVGVTLWWVHSTPEGVDGWRIVLMILFWGVAQWAMDVTNQIVRDDEAEEKRLQAEKKARQTRAKKQVNNK